MGLAVIFRLFGVALIGLGLAMLAPLGVAAAVEPSAVGDYLFGAIVTTAAGAGFASIGARPQTSDLRGAILTVLLWWILAPLFGAAPFINAGASVIDGYFEAASALTTTGAWLSEEAARASPAGALWRALMQWIGGLVSLAVAASVFIRPAFVGIDTLLPPFARGERESDLRALVAALGSFWTVYAAVTLLAWTVFVAGGLDAFNAATSAMSIAASGGFISGVDADAGGGLAYGVMLPFVFLSGANFVLIARFADRRRRRLQDVETGAYALIVFALAAALAAFAALGGADASAGLSALPAHAFNAASLMSTNGVTIGAAPPLAVALVAVIVGGSAVSTAGGLKILRWLVIFRRAREEVRRLITPSAAFGRQSVANELGVWIHFLMLTVTLGVLTLIITAGGYSFELSAAIAVALLSNAGPVAGLVDAAAGGYAVVEEPILRFVMIVGMILGRLEAVTALALFNRAFWRS